VLACRAARGPLTYVGWTLDPDRRLDEHNRGTGAKSTRGRAWAIIHVERLDSRPAAMRREWFLKRDRKLRKELLNRWLAGG
jgi:putative endonuclease